MKKLLYLLMAFAFLGMYACDEIPPDISPPAGGTDPGSGNEDLENQPRQVLLEDFTGVQCVNCPLASMQIEQMSAIFGEQLIPVAIHAGFYAVPFPDSEHDFRTDDGSAILGYVGKPLGYPSGVVNRTLFDGQAELQVNRETWNGLVTLEAAETPLVKIGIAPTFNEANRQLDIDLTFLPTQTFSNENLRYTVMIVENNIVDWQLTPNGADSAYTHKHILRDVITTNFDGDPITEDILPDVAFTKSVRYTLTEEWNENECEIIAFVHYSGASKEVLQAEKVHVVEE